MAQETAATDRTDDAPSSELCQLRSEKEKLEQRVTELERIISFQPETGLPSHFRLDRELDDLIRSMREKGDQPGFSLLIVQLGDVFQSVHKTLKASISEWILYQTGVRISELLGPDGQVFHTHESEFVILLPGLKDAKLKSFLKKLIARLREPHQFAHFSVSIEAVIGISYWPEHGLDRSAILHGADIAAGAARAQKKSWVQFKPELLSAALERIDLQHEIIQALENPSIDALGEQFKLYFQPKIIISGIVDGLVQVKRIEAETLLRWAHPRRGLVKPATFIPLAEETGLILPMGKWLIYQCARRMETWTAAGKGDISLSVNLSARQFHSEDATDILISALGASRVDPSLLTIELTETCLFERPETTRAILERMSSLGLKISVDDFGTGYSSLSHLHRFPLDEIKIDRLFIENLAKNHSDRIIVQSLVSIAKGLNLSLIAEGVETPEALKILWDMGCDGFQGYLFSKPLSPEDFIAFRDKIAADGMVIRY